MRFFTRAWAAGGELTDEEEARASSGYAARLAVVRPCLSVDASRLADADLHDAVIESIVWHPEAGRLELALVAGDLHRGYESVRVTYVGVTLGGHSLSTLRALGRDRRVELLADEVDLDPEGALQHRMLFWPELELTIGCADTALTTETRAERLLPPGDAFLELDDE